MIDYDKLENELLIKLETYLEPEGIKALTELVEFYLEKEKIIRTENY